MIIFIVGVAVGVVVATVAEPLVVKVVAKIKEVFSSASPPEAK